MPVPQYELAIIVAVKCGEIGFALLSRRESVRMPIALDALETDLDTISGLGYKA